MNRKKFHNILKRYGQGKATEAEKNLIDQWYELLDDDQAITDSTEDLSSIESRLWQKIKAQTHPEFSIRIESEQSTKYIWFKRFAVAAAAVGIVFLISIQLLSNKNEGISLFKPTASGLKVEFNNTQKPLIVRLEDGSSVTLQPKSKLSFPANFEIDRREVYLEGEAFFDVAKNPNRPFFVYSNNLVTHVLGTSFIVKPVLGKNEIEVSVLTGRVEVFENEKIVLENHNKKSKGVVLLPNQKVIYNSVSRQFEPSIVDNPLPLIAEPSNSSSPSTIVSFSFEEAPLSVVLKSIEQVYGVEIIAERESLYNCPFTGDIVDQNLYAKLDIINKVLNTTYEIKGTKILIKGKGCE